MESVRSALRQRYGIEMPPYQSEALRPLVERLGGSTGLGGGVDRLLSRDVLAWNAVIETITIPETYFFRHYPHFEQLAELAAQRFRAGRSCHVLSAGCSSGEEAWSAAAVLESASRGTQARFGVTGWDVHGPRLAEAAEGRYRDWSVRSGLHAYPDAVVRVGDHWQVARHLLPHVRFDVVNLMEALPPTAPRFDAIFFRNVAIYFRPSVAKQVAERLSGLLVDDGLFFVGPCDPVSLPAEEFEHLIVHGVRIYRRRARHAISSTPAQGRSPGSRRRARESQRPSTRPMPSTPRLARSLPPSPPRDSKPAETTKVESPALLAVQELADRGEYQSALAQLARFDEVTAHASMLEGVIRLNLEQSEEAIRCFRRAVYLDADCSSHRRWLALAYEAAGMSAEAERERRNAMESRMR